jgi:hypothetical protein
VFPQLRSEVATLPDRHPHYTPSISLDESPIHNQTVKVRIPFVIRERTLVAHRSGTIATKDPERVVVDTTVQQKRGRASDQRPAHPPRDREAARSAKREGVELRQSYLRVAKRAAIMDWRYTHAHQFKRTRRQLKFQHVRLGRVIRDLRRKIEGNTALEDCLGPLLDLASCVRHQEPHQRGPKIYSLHAPRWSAPAAIAITTIRTGFKVCISGQVRHATKAVRREMRRRATGEPVIGHLKED